MIQQQADSSATITLPQDSVANDSVPVKPKEFGITLQSPQIPVVEPSPHDSTGISIILLVMAVLFCIVGLRFRINSKFITVTLRNLMEVRTRSNAFDETVRETSYLVLLNVMWCASAGIMLWSALGFIPGLLQMAPVAELQSSPAATIGICMGVTFVYVTLMSVAYFTVGSVFSDTHHAAVWLKGFLAGNAMQCVIFFPLSLISLFYPQWIEILLWIALTSFILAKFVFIWKGFRIFFTQISSWVLFLYYLCSLEIVPLILAYMAAWWLCCLL